MQYIVLFLIVIFIIALPIQSFASTADYQWTKKFITHSPTICTIEPNDSMITGTIPEQYMKATKDAVFEWQYMLQSIAKKPENWNMNYVEVSKQDSFFYDYSKCDITINFKRQFDQVLPDGYGNILGIMRPQSDGSSIIDLYYQEFSTCAKSDKYYQYIYYCYYDDVAPATEIGLTARHEIGHALGLGHYLSSDPAENIRWGSIVDIAPSIMVQFDNQVKDFKKIQTKDIYKLKEVYGENGFGPKIKQPVQVEVPKPAINESEVVTLGPRETKTIKLSGYIPIELYKRGVPLSLTLTLPDGSKSTSAIRVTSHQYFEYPLMLSYNSLPGQYTITSEFEGHAVKNFSVYLSKSSVATPVPIPSNTVSSNVAKIQAENAKNLWKKDIEYFQQELKAVENTFSGLSFNENQDKSKLETAMKDHESLKQKVKSAQIRYDAGIYELNKGNYDKAQEYFDQLQTDKNTVIGLKEKILTQINDVNKQDKDSSNNKIPDWVRNNAKWWSDGSIDDKTFVSGMKHLIKEDIIKVPQTTNTGSVKEIPTWIKNNAKWWSEKTIDDESFISSMQYLISTGIINVSENTCSGTARCISGTVTEVIDGDTIKVGGQSIRFALTSAPELDEFNGPKARNLIESICSVGSKVLVDEDDKQTQGSYGRIIGLISCNEKILNEELVKSGIGTISKEFCNSSEFSMLSWAQNYGCAPTKSPTISPPVVTSPPKTNCDPSYPTVCIAPYPPDLNCKDVPYKKFKVLQPDPHGFDGDKDGIGCE